MMYDANITRNRARQTGNTAVHNPEPPVSGGKLHIRRQAEEFGVSTRTLRRDFNVRLTYLDIEPDNGVCHFASHYFRRRTERDMKILARLLHLDRLLPAMDAKLLSLLLDGEHPSPYRIVHSRLIMTFLH